MVSRAVASATQVAAAEDRMQARTLWAPVGACGTGKVVLKLPETGVTRRNSVPVMAVSR
jgi:hypothetical protein